MFFFVVVYFLDRFSPYGNDGGIRFKSKLCRCENCSKLLKRGGFRDYVCPFKEDHELKHEMGKSTVINSYASVIASSKYSLAEARKIIFLELDR